MRNPYFFKHNSQVRSDIFGSDYFVFKYLLIKKGKMRYKQKGLYNKKTWRGKKPSADVYIGIAMLREGERGKQCIPPGRK